VNDAFKPVTRYWDRICHPAQIIQSLPAAIATMLDPADCGPAFIGLPQDVQGWVYDYPTVFFEKKVHRIRRAGPDANEIADAAALLCSAKKPMIIAGGGVQYSKAIAQVTSFAEKYQIPVVETIAGRANLESTHDLNTGPLGVTGSDSANNIAEQADVILAVGTRLQDFTTGSWTAFAKDAQFISLNAARHDASKHRSLPVVSDAKLGIEALDAAMSDYKTPANWTALAHEERGKWDKYVAMNVSHGNRPNSYAQAIGTVDVEFGFSCMGYEIAGGWGARIAQSENEADKDTIVFTGDGSYLMLNSDLYSSVLSNKKIIVLVLDNGGFAVINKLQNNTGNESFNNLIKDCPTVDKPFAVDFEAHAASMGANAETVKNPAELGEAFKRAKASDKSCVIVMQVDAFDGWTTEGHTWWEIGTPHVTDNKKVRDAHEDWESSRDKQRRGV